MKNAGFVAVIGAVNMDICGTPYTNLIAKDSNPGTVRHTPGGVGRNIAHNLRKLEVPLKFFTAFGSDLYAEELRRSCQELGMDISEAVRADMATSSYLYITDQAGEMMLAVCDTDVAGTIDTVYLSSKLDVLNKAELVLFDGNLTEESIRFIAENVTAPLFADPVSCKKAERMRGILPKLHTFKPNDMEAMYLTGKQSPEEAAKALIELGICRVFVSCGGNGIVAAEGDNLVRLPCEPCTVVNTTGCGDAAMAALAWAYTQGLDLVQSARAALRAGAITAEAKDTIAPELCPDRLG